MKPVKVFIVSLLLMSVLVPVRFVHLHIAPLTLITPSATASPIVTPSKTPSATPTPGPTQTPLVVIVIHTRIVTVIATTSTPIDTATATLVPTNTVTPTPTGDEEKETGNQSPLSIAIIGMVATFIAGLVVGTLWSNLRKN
jgi:hypothetical protein